METLLARQLQQAWLETQVRKQSSDLSSSSTHGPSTPLSWAISSDPGAEFSSISATQTQSHNDDEEPFHDPVLQYINNMLMDEDLEDRKCMYAECMSYVKGFYDILGANEAPPCANEFEDLSFAGPPEGDSFEGIARKEDPSALTDGDARQDSTFSDFPAYVYDVNLGVLPDEVTQLEEPPSHDGCCDADVYAQEIGLKKFASTNEYEMKVPAQEDKNVQNLSGNEHSWIDDLLNNMDAIAAPASVVASPAVSASSYHEISESGSNYLSPQQSFDSTSLYEQNPLLKLDSSSPSFVADSTTLNFHGNHDNVQNVLNGNELHNPIIRSKEKDSRRSAGRHKVFTRSSSDTNTASVGTNSRSKRPAAEVDAATVLQNFSSFSYASSGVTIDAMGEESFSFVRNQDLNAERCASILNDGISSMNGTCCASSSASVREDGGRARIIVSTVADLKGLLISCAQAVASSNLRRAQEILQEIRQDASPYGSGLQRLAHYFAEGLVARLSGTGDRLYSVFTNNSPSAANMLKAHRSFVEVCPFVKVSHFFANRAILEAAKGASRLHIIDYGILYGLQWPSLISALAERKGGPPILRITGIDFPQPGYAHTERVEMTGRRLAEYARTYGVPFEYHAIASRWETVQPSSLSLRQDEVVVVHSMHRMHHLLDETVLASNPRKTVLSKINEINPKLFVQGVKNGNYNAPFFMSRFKEALACFSGLFDMLEALIRADNQERMMIEREVLGRDILNVVACEGPERVERPETYKQWQNRTQRAGFVQIPIDRNMLIESQTIVRCGYNKNFTVDEDGPWMLLSWKGKVIHGLSLWKPAGGR